MQGGPTTIALTLYWQQFKDKLKNLYLAHYPGSFDLSPYIAKTFPELPSDEVQALKLAFRADEAPKPEAQTQEVDECFIKNLLIAMQMSLTGEKLEALSSSPFKLKAEGEKLENYPKRFGDKELPLVNSEKTLAFAKLFFDHGVIFARGDVTSDKWVINKVLENKKGMASQQSEILKQRIAQYELASSPIEQLRKEVSLALVNSCNWLNSFEEAILKRIEKYINYCGTPSQSAPQPPSGFIGWMWGTITAPIYYFSSATPSEDKQEIAFELIWLFEKLSHYEKVIRRVDDNMQLCAQASQFVPLNDEHGEIQVRRHEPNLFLDPALLCNEFKMIVRHLQSYYENMSKAIKAFKDIESFTMEYFQQIDILHEHLHVCLQSHNFQSQPALERELADFMKALPVPTQAKALFFSHFQAHYAQPENFHHETGLVKPSKTDETNRLVAAFKTLKIKMGSKS